MTLKAQKIIVIGIIWAIFIARNILVIANWLATKGIPEKANWIWENFLTGTAIAVIIALLILLVNPGRTAVSGDTRSVTKRGLAIRIVAANAAIKLLDSNPVYR